MIFRTRSAAETRAAAAAIADLLRPGDVVVLVGDLGGGKTTFVQGLAAALGVREPVISPTFTIVREYEGRVPLAHVDAYRLRTVQELHDLGFEELVDGDRVTVVEWGDKVTPALPNDRLAVRFDLGDRDDERVVTVSTRGTAWNERARALAAALAEFAIVTAEG